MIAPRLGNARTIHGVADEAAYIAKHAAFCAANRAGQTRVRDERVLAYLNNGRWIADCVCGSGMGAHPGWASRCFGCGSIYAQVIFPEDWADIEEVIWVRPLRGLEWIPGIALRDLIADNDAVGLPVPTRLRQIVIDEAPI